MCQSPEGGPCLGGRNGARRLRPAHFDVSQALGNRVVVKAIDTETTTKSGLIIPDTASKEKPQEGEVIAIGPGKLDDNGKRVSMEVKVGDKVLFSKYAPDEIELDGEKLLILNEDDIKAIVK